ncbi:hypothetical protein L1887_09080 [Cichorium endivia]|nr:hypothetical protein L1887_09080 [Cichorium endivia]
MGEFTRILHSRKPDNLMDEIPTFVVDPLPSGLDRGHIVLNIPWAFVQWLERATIAEEYILMAELDHIFVNALPNLARGEYTAGFPFWDLKNGWTTNIKLLRKLLKTVELYKRAQLALGIGDEDLAREALKRRKSYAITNLSVYCRQKFLSIIATYLYLFTYKGNVLSFYFQHKQWVKNCKYFAIM